MLRVLALLVFGSCLLPLAHAKADESLAAKLQALDRLRDGLQTDLAAVDRLGEELLKAHDRPEEQAQIRYQLAHVHAQSGLKQPKKIIEYGQAALDSKLLTPEQRGMLYSYLSSAHEVDPAVKSFADRRKQALQPLLQGLAELQQFNLPKLAPEAPLVKNFEGDFQDRAAEEAARQRAAEAIRLRAETIRVQTLIARRNTLSDQVKWLYAREPLADEELQELAEKTIDKATAQELVASAKAYREEVERQRRSRRDAENK